MRIEGINPNEQTISLRGYGFDIFGTPFSDYGIKIHLGDKDEIKKIALYMFDRDVVIEYIAN